MTFSSDLRMQTRSVHSLMLALTAAEGVDWGRAVRPRIQESHASRVIRDVDQAH